MARVNMFLKMVRGGKVKDSYRKADSDIARAKTEITIEANLNPDDEDFNQAEIDIKEYNLNNFEFDSAEELYLDDEDEGLRFTFEV
jgi:carbonic anhydrase